MNSLSERLNMALEAAKIENPLASKAGLSRACNVRPSTVSDWFSGTTKSISGLCGMKAAEYLGVSTKWLISGVGTMKKAKTDAEEVEESEEDSGDIVYIPEYGYTLSAGFTGADAPTWEEIHNTSAVPYSREYLLRRMVKPESCRIATVSGDSMEPTLESGDKVLFSEFNDFTVGSYPIIDGCIYVIAIEGSMKIKRLSKIRGGILVMSDNERYSDEKFIGDQCDQVRIYGRVIEMRRKM